MARQVGRSRVIRRCAWGAIGPSRHQLARCRVERPNEGRLRSAGQGPRSNALLMRIANEGLLCERRLRGEPERRASTSCRRVGRSGAAAARADSGGARGDSSRAQTGTLTQSVAAASKPSAKAWASSARALSSSKEEAFRVVGRAKMRAEARTPFSPCNSVLIFHDVRAQARARANSKTRVGPPLAARTATRYLTASVSSDHGARTARVNDCHPTRGAALVGIGRRRR